MTDYKGSRRKVVSDDSVAWGVVVLVVLILALGFAGRSDYQAQLMLDQPTGSTLQARR